MPVTVAASGYYNKPFGGASASFTYTHPGGPLCVLVVARTFLATDVTANGTAMTLSGATTTGGCTIQRFYLDSIATFTGGTIAITYSADSYYGGIHIFSLAGATATPFGTVVTNYYAGGTSAPTVTVSSTTGDKVIGLITHLDTAVTFSNGAGQALERGDVGTNGSDPTLRQELSLVSEDGAASVVIDGTLSASRETGILAFSVAASGGGGGVSDTLYRGTARGVLDGVSRGVAA